MFYSIEFRTKKRGCKKRGPGDQPTAATVKTPYAIHNGTVRFKKCKQNFEYQHVLLLRDIWGSKF